MNQVTGERTRNIFKKKKKRKAKKKRAINSTGEQASYGGTGENSFCYSEKKIHTKYSGEQQNKHYFTQQVHTEAED